LCLCFSGLLVVATITPAIISPIVVFNLLRLIQKLKIAQNELECSLKTDFLTNIYNRRHIVSLLKDDLRKGCRYKFPVSIILMDVDNFKKVNDSYGHDASDYILKEFSNIISKAIRNVN